MATTPISEDTWAEILQPDPRLPDGWGTFVGTIQRFSNSPPNGGFFVLELDGWVANSKYTNHALGYRGTSYKQHLIVGVSHTFIMDSTPNTQLGHYCRYALPTSILRERQVDIIDLTPPVNLRPFPGRISDLDENGNVRNWVPSGASDLEVIEDPKPGPDPTDPTVAVARCRWCGKLPTKRALSPYYCSDHCAYLAALAHDEPGYQPAGTLAGHLVTHPRVGEGERGRGEVEGGE
jgi:hypothetical protein